MTLPQVGEARSSGVTALVDTAPLRPDLRTAPPRTEADRNRAARRARRLRLPWVPLLAYLATRPLVLIPAWIASRSDPRPGAGPWPRLPPAGDLVSTLSRWDAAWYLDLAQRGYPSAGDLPRGLSRVAFYPLLPGLLRTLSSVPGVSMPAAGMIVALVTGAAGVVAVWHLVVHLAGPAAGGRAAVLLCCFPGSFVLSMPYAEGIAIAATAWSLLMALRRRWWWAGVLGAAATAARPNTIVVVLALAAAAWLARERRAWVAPLTAATGVATVWAALWWQTGMPLAWIRTERTAWKDYVDWGATTLARLGRTLVSPTVSLEPSGLVDLVCAIGAVVAMAGAVALLRWRPPLPVMVYGLGAAAFTSVSAVVGPRPRMLLGAFPLVVAAAIPSRPHRFRILVVTSAAALVALSWVTFSSLAVAP